MNIGIFIDCFLFIYIYIYIHTSNVVLVMYIEDDHTPLKDGYSFLICYIIS
jgi:hypothetical protein